MLETNAALLPPEIGLAVCKDVVLAGADEDLQTAHLVQVVRRASIEQYAKLIEKAAPKFVEIKAYMFVGASRQRLSIENMPRHHEVKEFTEEILKHLKNYKLKDEKKESRVVLLSRL